jgi:hypothetical protein
LTEAEDAVLQVRAAAAGVTVAALLAEAGLGQLAAPDRRAVISELFAIRRHVAGMATNVNELAAAANSEVFVSAAQVSEVLDQWSALRDRLDAVLDDAK